MAKYEIMLILDPKSDDQVISEIAKSSFKNASFELQKLERTELAYEIKKSKTAFYYLLNTEATGVEINEFLRKVNIAKNIWRVLSLNLDTERGLHRKAKPKRVRRPFVRRPQMTNQQNQAAGPNNSGETRDAEGTNRPKRPFVRRQNNPGAGADKTIQPNAQVNPNQPVKIKREGAKPAATKTKDPVRSDKPAGANLTNKAAKEEA